MELLRNIISMEEMMHIYIKIKSIIVTIHPLRLQQNKKFKMEVILVSKTLT
jgi:hypothetical protein